ncbi:sensor histidine kinase [Streptomyces sp. NBC_00343]|uniref:sensor histidine kinase n=1 Tax=Streptomyces sp. NBC_00343 TaxID=2975719 RepID=UPI002E2C5B77|nr:sensor histidine kinase [Streptomyces sp. NBC_00343]
MTTFVLGVVTSALPPASPTHLRAPDTFAMVIVGLGSACLFLHRDHPRLATGLTTVCALVLALAGIQLNPLLQAPCLVSLFLLALRTDRRTARIGAVTATTTLLAATLVHGPESPWGFVIIGMVSWTLLPGAVGDAVRSNTEYLAAAEARAELAEHTREEEALRRVSEERVRMARDLHDVVAHHIALAATQARTTQYLMRHHPERAPEMMENLCDSTDEALRELRATVGLLRQRGDTDSPRDPAPGLAQLPDLLGSFERAGLSVDVTTQGEAQPLSPGVDLTAYRVIQEALTNVTKHAGTSSARVRLAYTRSWVTITVVNEGRPVASASSPGHVSGYGLIGMRERAQSVGGRLQAGPGKGGGFAVTLGLPMPKATQHPYPEEVSHQ